MIMRVFNDGTNVFSGRSTIKQIPTQERLKFLFNYRNDGNLIWKNKNPQARNIKIGDVAGYLEKNGYTRVRVDGDLHLLHRLIKHWHDGDLNSNMVIDHIDNNPSNNRIENLQVLTNKENTRKRKKHSNNSSGLSWVYWDKNKKKWNPQYRDETGKLKNLGLFDNKYHAYHIAAEATAKVKGSNHKEQLSTEDRHAYMDWLIEYTDNQNKI